MTLIMSGGRKCGEGNSKKEKTVNNYFEKYVLIEVEFCSGWAGEPICSGQVRAAQVRLLQGETGS